MSSVVLDGLEYNPEPAHQVAVDEYHEEVVGVKEFVNDHFTNLPELVKNYLILLFPIARWILHYNREWLVGDLIAGITVGAVLVPQSMSYAQIALLLPEYGLYLSFVGVFIYCFFATSKDVLIGPVAVMSLQVAKVIEHVQNKNPDYKGPEVATILSLLCGIAALGLGVLRLGFILEFISMPAVLGFMTGSAFTIIVGQVPGLLGFNKRVNTRTALHLVVIHSLQNLKHTTKDAIFGLIPLVILYLWRYGCDKGAQRFPKYRLWFFYTNVLRNAVIIIVFTAILYGICKDHRKKPPISILGKVPLGLRHVGVMTYNKDIVTDIASELPVLIIVLMLEHIAISKLFARINDYKVIPDQEVIAIGVTNLIGTFFNAYPATGSFLRSALKSKCGVRTPLAGIFTGVVVLLALYALTGAFYWIPKATLCAIIIHAVLDLISSYKSTWLFWKVLPFDCGIFIIDVFLTVFISIEVGVYFAMCALAAVLLFRIAMPKGQFLGRVRVAEVVDAVVVANDAPQEQSSSSEIEIGKEKVYEKTSLITSGHKVSSLPANVHWHTRWVPLDARNTNKLVPILPAPPGVLVFRPVEAFTYPNALRQIEKVLDEVKRLFKRGTLYALARPGARPWNDPAPLDLTWAMWGERKRLAKEKLVALLNAQDVDERPELRILHLDFSSVTQIDATGAQALVDLRKVVDRYAGHEVEIHFSGILLPWIRRLLINSGFGYPGGSDDAGAERADGAASLEHTYFDIAAEYTPRAERTEGDEELNYVALVPTDTPFFHYEIPSYE